MRNTVKYDIKKKKVISELSKALGIVALACKRADVSRKTFYRWYNTDEEFKEEVDDIYETQGDFVEDKLLGRIRENDTTAIIFYLKTKGKKRGYYEKVEQDVHVNEFERLMKELPEYDG